MARIHPTLVIKSNSDDSVDTASDAQVCRETRVLFFVAVRLLVLVLVLVSSFRWPQLQYP